ncbi:MAG: DNA gyrase/topoisomerase IV subunit A [Bacteroidales bacterium]|nr:DNA gyrase/topoisomerase IV subunit A [Bacteroidales bacterium]
MIEDPNDNLEINNDDLSNVENEKELHDVNYISGMYKNWFLDYASYVILERAVPHVFDGLKPVQRRILHSMKRLDDGRYNKVANIIGHTMQFHPHGDASIGDALVQLGQKDILIDAQGNWGNILTGDSAAAPRYIEARLSKFALDVVFNPKTTIWKLSYDGRNKEPINLPVKFPLLLAQGVEGIAVGLASKILPHNFIELIDASIAYLRGEEFELLPDFPTAGMADFSKYNDGLRGGKVRVRAKIERTDKKTLIITEIPFGKTTGSLIDSILAANDKGKIKIRKIDDNTAEHVEIVVHLVPGTSPDKMIDALYAFTDCEVPISPNSTVIQEDKPVFLGVSELLRLSTDNTLNLLKTELQIRLSELDDAWHLSSLEKIFIENKIYLLIEECETWDDIIQTIDKGLEPFKKLLKRVVVHDDIVRLTEIKIKRISKFDAFKADEYIKNVENEMKEVNFNLTNIVDYTVNHFETLKKKYGKGRERKTEIRSFDVIEATKVVVANEKLYVNYEEGFAGTSLKKDEFVSDCSDIDDIIIFRKDGSYVITKVADKIFIGTNAIHVAVFMKNDSRTIYNLIYRDGKTGYAYMKRFAVKGITRDKEYFATQGNPNSRLIYFSANPNGEAEVVKVMLKPRPRLKKLSWELDFSELEIKGRNSMGNILTKHMVHKITIKEKGVSTLTGQKIWFDWDVFRLNIDHRGELLGEFKAEDKIVMITKAGYYRMTSYDLSNHYEDGLLKIEKFRHGKTYSAVYFDPEKEFYFLKRFELEESDKNSWFIPEEDGAQLICLSEDAYPQLKIEFTGRHKDRPVEIINVHEFIGVKGFKAKGKRLSTFETGKIEFIEPLEIEEPEFIERDEEELETEEFDDENNGDDIPFEITDKDGNQQSLDL